MMTAWTETLARGWITGSVRLGSVLIGSVLIGLTGCVVTVDDDPDDNFGGNGGTLGVSGSGGRGGSSGASGSGGSAGDGGGGTGGVPFPAPTCEAEDDDDLDECRRCMKQSCCTPWLACNDQTCADEFVDVSECVSVIEFATSEDLGMCITMASAAEDGFAQANTQDLISCAISPAGDAGLETLCSLECFGSDIFPE